MASMGLNTVQQDLIRRFAAPLPEFYKRRIIFWYDEDREFEDQLEDLVLDGVKLARLNGSNTFTVKKLLCEEDTATNYLVYDPRSLMKDDDNWLINVQLYSEEFRADLNSIWMDEMGLPVTPIIRNQVKNYRKFFRARERRETVKKLSSSISTAAQMHLAVMSALCGNSDINPSHIIKAVVQAGLDLDTNVIYQSFLTYGAEKPFWVMVAQATGYNEGDDANLGRLTIHMLLTAATRTIHLDHLTGLDVFISTPHQAWCYDFVSDWLHSADNHQLYEVARYVEYKARLAQRFSKLAFEDLVDTEVFPCINECLLMSLMKEINDHIIQVETIKKIVEKRRTMVWYDDVSSYYEGLLQVANMQAFFLEHSAGFHIVEPNNVWAEYTTDYYKMDTYYRQFHLCFQKALKRSNSLLDDLFKRVTERVEGIYSHWFLGQLSQNWSAAAAEDLEKYGYVFEVAQQNSFYANKVATKDNRVFVIISDALRFEVAAELAEQLRRETQSNVTLNSQEAVFPTATKYGMAALLPHKKLEVVERSNGTLGVLADGQSTDAGYRDKVLKNTNNASVALRYDDIIGMKRAERSALVKGMEVVYIYHDKVDEASHTSDSAVFPACEEAIAEIKNLVRIIVNEFGGISIIITADHGFLYTYSPFTEDGKVDKTTPSDQDVEIDRRYLITRKGVKPDYLLPVRFMGSDAGYEAWAPRENIRIKKKGGGLNYVHGGISLQEMVVPVIEYQFLRSSSKAYQRNKDMIDTKPVTVSLLSAGHKISNMIFSLNFFQNEAVGGNRESAIYLLYFVDSNGQKISDEQKIIADKTSENTQDRTFRCSFNLRSQKYSNMDSYYLIIVDETGLQMPVKEEFQIDIAFAVDEFNFF